MIDNILDICKFAEADDFKIHLNLNLLLTKRALENVGYANPWHVYEIELTDECFGICKLNQNNYHTYSLKELVNIVDINSEIVTLSLDLSYIGEERLKCLYDINSTKCDIRNFKAFIGSYNADYKNKLINIDFYPE